jgi:hypothetical protein
VTDSPDTYVGKTITVEAQVNKIQGDKAYTIGGERNGGGTPLLVIGTSPLPGPPLKPAGQAVIGDDIVAVTGRVVRLDRDNVPEPLQSQLKPDLYTEYAGQPALLADRVFYTVVLGGVEEADAAQRAEATGPNLATVEAVTSSKDRLSLLGRWVELNTVKVQSVISDRGFWVESKPGVRLFVMLNKALDRGQMEWLVNIDKGQVLNIRGVLERMPDAEQIQKMWAVDAQEAQTLAGEQVYVRAFTIQMLLGS